MRFVGLIRPSQYLIAAAALAAVGLSTATHADQSGPGDVVSAANAAQVAAGRCDAAGFKAAAGSYAAARGAASTDDQNAADAAMSQAFGAFAACGHGGAGATTDGQMVTLPLTLYAADSAGWLGGMGCVPTAIATPSGTMTGLLPAVMSPAVAAPLADGRTAVVWQPAAVQPSLGALAALTGDTHGECHPTGAAAPLVLATTLPAPALDIPSSPLETGNGTTTTTSNGSSTSTFQVSRTVQSGGSAPAGSGQGGQPVGSGANQPQGATAPGQSQDTAPSTGTPGNPSGGSTSPTTAAPALQLSRKLALPGTMITVSGSGFTPNGTATLCWSGSISTCQDVSGTGPGGIAVDGNGAFSFTFAVPNDAAGQHTIDVADSAGLEANATFNVMGS